MAQQQLDLGDSGIGDIGFSFLNHYKNNYYKRERDPLLLQGGTSPSGLNKYHHLSPLAPETSPTKFFTDESIVGNITTFIDAIPDKLLDSLPNSINCSPLDNDIFCSEVFQDLRHTSTPKSSDQKARKRIKFTDGGGTKRKSGRSWHVLHDITDQNILHSSDSFVKLTFNKDVEEANKSEENTRTPVIRRVPILRGNSRKLSERSDTPEEKEETQCNGLREFLYPYKCPSVRERDKWLYYTGFTDYDLMMRVITHISVPPEHGLMSFQILMLTLMRLKCDLDWRDLSFRFRLFEATTFALFHSTIKLLSYSLSEMIEWTLPACPRISNLLIYIYPVTYKNDTLKQIFLFISNLKRPIVYVSDPVPVPNNPFVTLSSCHNYFINNDELCVKGFSQKDNPTFFRVTKCNSKINLNYVESKNSESDSESNYGSYFGIFANMLTSLFRKGFDTQTNLMKLIDDKLIFSANKKRDIALLKEVLERVALTGEVVVSLELKASVDQWKVFAKLVSKFSAQLKCHLDLTVPVKVLSNSIHRIMLLLFSNQTPVDPVSQIKHFKLGNFILKVIIKICELYSGSLGESYKDLTEILINLYKFHHQLDSGSELYSGFKTYLYLASAPLISNLLDDEKFIQEISRLCGSLNSLTYESRIGCYGMIVNILKKLTVSNDETQSSWLNNGLISCILNIVRDCSPDLKAPYQVEDREGYSCLVSGLTVIMISLDCLEFQQVEKLLFTSLLQGDYFTSVFVQDLICSVALFVRFTNNKVLEDWIFWLKDRTYLEGPQVVHVTLLCQRLLQIWNSHSSVNILHKPPSFGNIPLKPSKEDYFDLIESLSLFDENVNCENEGIDSLMQLNDSLWKCVMRTAPSSEPTEVAIKGIHWWTRLFYGLCCSTSALIVHISSDHFVQILNYMVSLYKQMDCFCKLSVLKVLTAYSKSQPNRPISNEEITSLSHLFELLISDTDVIISQFAVESFGILVSSWPDQVVQELYSKSGRLETKVCHYFQQQVSEIEEEFDIFSDLMEEYSHKCAFLEQDGKAQTCDPAPPSKKCKLSDDLDSLLISHSDTLRKINQILNKRTVTQEQKLSLLTLLKEYEILKEKIL